MKNKTGLLLLNLTGCVAFLSVPVLLSPDVAWNLHFIKLPPFQKEFFSYVLILGFFYFHHFYLFPVLYFRHRYLLYAVAVLACYIIVVTIPPVLITGQPMTRPPEMMVNPPSGYPMPPPPGLIFRLLPRFEYLFQFLVALIVSALIRITNRLRQAEKERVSAELSYLKAQINPHFLFNTLNSIYSQALRENADATAGAIVKLSGMMRFVISEAHHDFVPLDKEAGYISDYIELQKMRLGETAQVNFCAEGITAGKRIAPLLLISFIENAFKHGISPGQVSVISIVLALDGNKLSLSVSNRKAETSPAVERSNIGLENTRNRLQLLYPSDHTLTIEDNGPDFIVHLTILLR